MPVTADEIEALLPEMDPGLVSEHLGRLDSRYLARFEAREVAEHLRRLASLSETDPVALLVHAELPTVRCTVLAFDHPGVFSLITGVLSSMGFNIDAGDIFTYGPARAADSPLRRRRIIDRFTGVVGPEDWDGTWEDALRERLREVFSLLEQGGEQATRARRKVNEMAAQRLGRLALSSPSVLYPVTIDVDTSNPALTRMTVGSQDTPFFLFTFSTALTLQEVSIEQVTIRTLGSRIEDEFEFVDKAGRPITDLSRLDRIKFSLLLTKQFTSFLARAPDPLAALLRFESMVRDIVPLPGQGRWMELLSDPKVLAELAQLLGASTFLWEDFIRLQYETLLPMLSPHVGGRSFCEPIELLPERLEMAIAGANDTDEFARRLNDFKDREIFLYDLDHILTPGSDFLTLSRRLTALAARVVDSAAAFAWQELVARFGEPRTVAGLPVRFAIMGLGKMGGAALGYASDIELLFVYGDSGSTSGPETIDNTEFFDRLVKAVLGLVRAKREGIFHIDLRLRPYAAAGPLACSLESFCTYYAKDGPAHSYERLALVRLRAVGGDRSLGQQVERLRDEMVYRARSIKLEELTELREKQVQQKTRTGSLNAKFSPGALVDLEYAVQVLQVIHGTAERSLRTPRIHEALEALATIGVVDPADAEELVGSYRFFRRLINGLRMLRGSAQDLFLPRLDSDEYMHLARRMSYEPEPDMSPAQKLHLDFETHSAAVRAFGERHFGRGSLPGSPAVTIADLILSDAVPEAMRTAALAERGFRDPAKAYGNLRRIAGEADRRTLFARLAILGCDVLSEQPDPDMALNNWERFIHGVADPAAHLRQMLSQPMRLEIMLRIFSASQFLADAIVREPRLLDHIGRPEILHAHRSSGEIAADLERASREAPDRERWLDVLREYRRREILRIGARDICLGVPTRTIMEEISDVADGLIQAALARIRRQPSARKAEAGGGPPGTAANGSLRFCVLAFGKLGGRELNYSSDIDLLGLFEGDAEEATAVMEQLRADLSSHTPQGYVYRVDLRLRPYGSAGQLVFPLHALGEYYARSASLWELQALLKARPVAGDTEIGDAFLQIVRGLLLQPRSRSDVTSSIDRLRREALKSLSRNHLGRTDLKAGLGGLRDIEFLCQGLQMVKAPEFPSLLRGNTVDALEGLGAVGVLGPESVERLVSDYLFLRRVEHFLQIYEDRQTHSLPSDPEQLRALARRMMGSGATAEQFLARLSKRFDRVREDYEGFLKGTLG